MILIVLFSIYGYLSIDDQVLNFIFVLPGIGINLSNGIHNHPFTHISYLYSFSLHFTSYMCPLSRIKSILFYTSFNLLPLLLLLLISKVSCFLYETIQIYLWSWLPYWELFNLKLMSAISAPQLWYQCKSTCVHITSKMLAVGFYFYGHNWVMIWRCMFFCLILWDDPVKTLVIANLSKGVGSAPFKEKDFKMVSKKYEQSVKTTWKQINEVTHEK